MKNKIFTVIVSLGLILMMCTSPAFARVWVRVEGTVKAENGQPIEGAKVILIFSEDGAKHELTTDKKGFWRKLNMRPGAWAIGFMADGYTPDKINITLSAIKKNPPINIILKPAAKSPVGKADILYQQGKYAEALREYQRMLEENQNLHHIWEQIGLCYYRQNDKDNAIAAFKKMLEKEPGSRNSLVNLSSLYLEKGNLDEGMKYFKQLDEESLTDPAVFYNIGVLLFNNNRMDMAIDYFKKSITRKPGYVNAYNQMAMAYLNKGDMEAAKKNFQKVIELAPESEPAAQAKEILKSLNQ